jgi:hypothetical protein
MVFIGESILVHPAWAACDELIENRISVVLQVEQFEEAKREGCGG